MKRLKLAGSAYDQPSDAELVQQIVRGDRTAAGVLVARHQKPVRSFLLRLAGREDAANDLAQETFLRALRYMDRYDPKYSMRTWLLTIARRLWINEIRKQSRRNRGRQSSEVVDSVASPDPPPDDRAERVDEQGVTRRMLDEAMIGLTDAQRTALTLFHQQGLSMIETAEVMKMPIGTVKSHLHRGRATLRELLAPKMEMIEQ